MMSTVKIAAVPSEGVRETRENTPTETRTVERGLNDHREDAVMGQGCQVLAQLRCSGGTQPRRVGV